MTGILIEYFIGLFLIGTSLDDVKKNAFKVIGGIILIVFAVLHMSLV